MTWGERTLSPTTQMKNRQALTIVIFIFTAFITGVGIYLTDKDVLVNYPAQPPITEEKAIRRFIVQDIELLHKGATLHLFNTRFQKIEKVTLRHCKITKVDYVFLPVWIYRDRQSGGVTNERIISSQDICAAFK